MPPRREYRYAKGGLCVAKISDKENEIYRYLDGDKNANRKKVNGCRLHFHRKLNAMSAARHLRRVFFFGLAANFDAFCRVSELRPRKCNAHWTPAKSIQTQYVFNQSIQLSA